MGLLLLGNIAAIAVLSTPLPFRFFMNEPANTIVFNFPFVWLPVFVVPFAALLHVLSIKKIWMHVGHFYNSRCSRAIS